MKYRSAALLFILIAPIFTTIKAEESTTEAPSTLRSEIDSVTEGGARSTRSGEITHTDRTSDHPSIDANDTLGPYDKTDLDASTTPKRRSPVTLSETISTPEATSIDVTATRNSQAKTDGTSVPSDDTDSTNPTTSENQSPSILSEIVSTPENIPTVGTTAWSSVAQGRADDTSGPNNNASLGNTTASDKTIQSTFFETTATPDAIEISANRNDQSTDGSSSSDNTSIGDLGRMALSTRLQFSTPEAEPTDIADKLNAVNPAKTDDVEEVLSTAALTLDTLPLTTISQDGDKTSNDLSGQTGMSTSRLSTLASETLNTREISSPTNELTTNMFSLESSPEASIQILESPTKITTTEEEVKPLITVPTHSFVDYADQSSTKNTEHSSVEYMEDTTISSQETNKKTIATRKSIEIETTEQGDAETITENLPTEERQKESFSTTKTGTQEEASSLDATITSSTISDAKPEAREILEVDESTTSASSTPLTKLVEPTTEAVAESKSSANPATEITSKIITAAETSTTETTKMLEVGDPTTTTLIIEPTTITTEPTTTTTVTEPATTSTVTEPITTTTTIESTTTTTISPTTTTTTIEPTTTTKIEPTTTTITVEPTTTTTVQSTTTTTALEPTTTTTIEPTTTKTTIEPTSTTTIMEPTTTTTTVGPTTITTTVEPTTTTVEPTTSTTTVEPTTTTIEPTTTIETTTTTTTIETTTTTVKPTTTTTTVEPTTTTTIEPTTATTTIEPTTTATTIEPTTTTTTIEPTTTTTTIEPTTTTTTIEPKTTTTTTPVESLVTSLSEITTETTENESTTSTATPEIINISTITTGRASTSIPLLAPKKGASSQPRDTESDDTTANLIDTSTISPPEIITRGHQIISTNVKYLFPNVHNRTGAPTGGIPSTSSPSTRTTNITSRVETERTRIFSAPSRAPNMRNERKLELLSPEQLKNTVSIRFYKDSEEDWTPNLDHRFRRAVATIILGFRATMEAQGRSSRRSVVPMDIDIVYISPTPSNIQGHFIVTFYVEIVMADGSHVVEPQEVVVEALTQQKLKIEEETGLRVMRVTRGLDSAISDQATATTLQSSRDRWTLIVVVGACVAAASLLLAILVSVICYLRGRKGRYQPPDLLKKDQEQAFGSDLSSAKEILSGELAVSGDRQYWVVPLEDVEAKRRPRHLADTHL